MVRRLTGQENLMEWKTTSQSGAVGYRAEHTAAKRAKRASFLRQVKMHRALLLMLIPGMAYFLLFRYVPLFGSVIAFQDYNIFKGFLGSEWVGFANFRAAFASDYFSRILTNNLIISFYQLAFFFPAPILLALLLNEVRSMLFKRTIQTAVYLPHFLSWSIIAGLAYMLLSMQTGLVNALLLDWGVVDKPIAFLQNARYTRGIIVGTGIWKETGWSAIIYLAAITGVSPNLYEAARIDGAGRFRQCLHVTLPGILPTVVTLLLLRIGNIMDMGLEHVLPFINAMTASKGEVFDTYTYQIGVVMGRYSITTAMGLFKSVIGLILLLIANKTSKWATGNSLL